MSVQPAPASSSAAPPQQRLRSVRKTEALQRKTAFFSANARVFARAFDDVIAMVGDVGPALVFGELAWQARDGGRDAPLSRVAQASIAKRLRLSRETVSKYLDQLASPMECRFCQWAHPLIRKIAPRYPTERAGYELLDDCAHVRPAERADVASVAKTRRSATARERNGDGTFVAAPPRVDTDGPAGLHRGKNGRYTAEPPIAEQMGLPGTAQGATEPAASLPSFRLTPSSFRGRLEAGAVRDLARESAQVDVDAIPDEVLELLGDELAALAGTLLNRVAGVARLNGKPITADLAKRVLKFAEAELASQHATAPMDAVAAPSTSQKLAYFPANSSNPDARVPDRSFTAMLALAKGKTTPKQLRQIYLDELLPAAIAESAGDVVDGEQLLLLVLRSRRVARASNPIGLLRDAARHDGETQPYLRQLLDAARAGGAAIGKLWARVDEQLRGDILGLLRAHERSGGRFPQAELDRAGMLGPNALAFLHEQLDSS